MSTQTKALTIVLGIGHGGNDPGACNGKRRECDDNLRFGLEIKSKLEPQGHKVILTRTTDIAMTPEQRRAVAINMGADIFIDLHRNSFNDASAKGIEIWISNNTYSAAAAEVLSRLVAIENQANRGIKIASYRALYGNPMPSMLIELGFISNTKDNELYDKHFSANAEAIARGAVAACGQAWVEPNKVTETPKQTATIQMGRSEWPKNEAALRKLAAEIKAAGFDCFLVLPETVIAKENE